MRLVSNILAVSMFLPLSVAAPDWVPISEYRLMFLENCEELEILSEESLLDVSETDFSAVEVSAQIKNVYRMKCGADAAGILSVPFYGRARAPQSFVVTCDGNEIEGRLVYGRRCTGILSDKDFDGMSVLPPKANGGGFLYTFDTSSVSELSYTLKRDRKAPIFQDACYRKEERDGLFFGNISEVADSYGVFVGGESEIVGSNTPYSVRELTYDEYFKETYDEIELLSQGEDLLCAPREYHYASFVYAVEQGLSVNSFEFFFDNDTAKVCMLYVFDLDLREGEEFGLNVQTSVELRKKAVSLPLWKKILPFALPGICACAAVCFFVGYLLRKRKR